MQDLLSLLSQDPLTTISVIVAIAGIILAYIFYRKSRRSKDPAWAVRNTVLIEGYSTRFAELTVAYKGSVVENLSVARLAFWNEGSETINGSDIAAANPLRFVPASGRLLLDAKILAVNNPSSQLAVTLNPNLAAATLPFDYLDRGHGGVVQIVHTGTSSRDLLLQGDIKGATKTRKKDIRVWRYIPLPLPQGLEKRIGPSGRRRIRALIYLSMAFTLLALTVFLAAVPEERPDRVPDIIGYLLSGAYFVILSALALRVWLAKPPSGLEAFEEDSAP